MNLNNNKTFRHPVFKNYYCNELGQVFFKNKRLIKPVQIKNDLYIVTSYLKLNIYPVKRLVYESINDIEEAPLIMHLDSNFKNNCINNLDLLHIKSYD